MVKKRTTSRAKDRTPRTDGDATRLHILNTAGQLFALHGFDQVTSKMICLKAGVNLAAVNYHFGGREGLYRTILTELHQRFANLEELTQLIGASASPVDQLNIFLRTIIEQIDSQDWHFRFYAREALTANVIFVELLQQYARPKAQILLRILSQITGLPEDHPRLPMCFISVMAPCILPLIALKPASYLLGVPTLDKVRLAEHVTQFALAGLQGVANHPSFSS